jgi:23S rRNA pseudouridine1911/1915/1917 synthase
MIEILFEDNHLLVVNKPAGLLTQPSGTDQDSLEAQAKAYLKEKYNKPGNVFLEAVHRLDKPVSGIVIFAKTSKALSRLNESLRSKQAKKIYRAWVEGIPKQKEATLEHYLQHGDFVASVVSKEHPEAKLARLSYKMLESKENSSLLEITLETGRYHQIRAQLAAIGHPILGDTKYGSKTTAQEIALTHVRLEIEHPVTKEKMLFSIKEDNERD